MIFEQLFWLLVGHAVADFPLQGGLAKAKNMMNPLPGVPWMICMFAHALIHGGMVMLVTNSIVAALAETVAHYSIDCLKCSAVIDFKADQILHIVCKVIWLVLLSV